MLALIDNYDSFTYNLVQYLGELGAEIRVFRNDQVSLDELIALKPDHLVVSPGPGEPIKDGGVSPEAVRHFTGKIPVLGVCLGHQCLGAVYGGKVDRAARLMHGKTSSVKHNGQGIFKDIPSPFEGMRYHSLIVHEPVPAELEVLATTSEGEIMALKHREHPTYGVQFHPESILTEHGKKLLKNFLDLKPAPAAGGEQAMLKPFIAKAINRVDLTAEEAEEAMNIIMTGQATHAQIGAYLVALRMKGETIPEITGSVRAMRDNAVKVQLAQTGESVYDIVGTGGDGAHTFNISTAAAFILAVSRAVGETMIVAIAAGQQPRLTANPFVPLETMTAYIVQVSLGDTPQGTLEYRTIFAVGMLLFLMTFALNLVSTWLRERFREEYV